MMLCWIDQVIGFLSLMIAKPRRLVAECKDVRNDSDFKNRTQMREDSQASTKNKIR